MHRRTALRASAGGAAFSLLASLIALPVVQTRQERRTVSLTVDDSDAIAIDWRSELVSAEERRASRSRSPAPAVTPRRPAPPAPRQRSVASTRRRGGTHRGYATIEECIAAVENGGSYGRSSNPSHFGRYQFDRNAWRSYGGDPGQWGSASPEEQDRVFANAMAAGAHSRWVPYDGCG